MIAVARAGGETAEADRADEDVAGLRALLGAS
jgi:hypothetical protein